MRRIGWMGLPLVAGGLLVGTACDLDQSFLFPDPIEDVPGVVDLGNLTPVPLSTRLNVQDQVIYGELGPTGTALTGGATFTFDGIGGSVCVWVDPELAYWNQSVSPADPVAEWSQPDNVFDDGDIDLTGGLSVYYTGTPGVEIGDFEVRYQDDLGNVVPIQLVECVNTDEYFGNPGAHSGRGSPEFCTLSNTLAGTSYTIVMSAWSLPLDDDRLAYGLLVTEGSCEDLRDFMGTGGANRQGDECLITGEAIIPGQEQGIDAAGLGLPGPTWLGSDEPDNWSDSEAFEDAFCSFTLRDYCRAERQQITRQGLTCAWENDASIAGNGERCFCGDLSDTPSGGSF
ncbi:MAG: hypothetical protein H6733_13325 [Alphaproteobacteria bacterium]|nr:hypothetical protein [Alphaproteobacteria bacterium]